MPEPQKTGQDTCLLPPLDLVSNPVISTPRLAIPGKAKREYLSACSALVKNKTAEAEKQLRKAVRDNPKYSAAWVTLGQVLAAQQRLDEARNACREASTVDPVYVSGYLCLADIAARSRNWTDELKFSDKALELDPSRDPVAYEYNAAANANMQNLDEAEKSAWQAIEVDRDHREPPVYFLLAQIYEMKGNSAGEAEQLRQYLKYTHSPQGVAKAKLLLSNLDDGIKEPVDLASAKVPQVTSAPTAKRWGPADIDESIPPVLQEVNCPLAQILKETSRHTEDLIENLQRFSARDRIEQIDVDKDGNRRNSTVETANYVAQIEQTFSPYPVINEYRAGSTRAQRAPVVDSGTAAFALIFHPSHLGNLSFRCEGSTELLGQRAWQLRFEESADSGKAFTAMRVDGFMYMPRLKGRAWIADGSYNVLRIETDLMGPIRQIDLKMEHMIINYAPVEFPARHLRLLLPETASLYISYRGHRYERVHSFSEFQLFSVETTEATKSRVRRLIAH